MGNTKKPARNSTSVKAGTNVAAAKQVDRAKEEEEEENFMPGQRYATPEDGDSLRIFYTTLLEQRPESKLALKWILEHGLCPSYDKAVEL